MINTPLHPAVVHLPLGLAVLMPFFLIGTWFAIDRKWAAPKLWSGLVLLQLVLFGFGLLAVQTGEYDEEKVEHIVQEQVLEHHEETAELFVDVSGALILLLAAGLWSHRKYGPIIKGACTVALFLNFILAMLVGHSGGELVYKYNAASAHTTGSEQSLQNRPQKE